MKNSKELINRIEVLEAKLTCRGLADALGVSDRTVRAWKEHTREMPRTAIILLGYLEKEFLRSKRNI